MIPELAPTVEQLDQFPSDEPADQDVWFSAVARFMSPITGTEMYRAW
jgi:hypothetical protein